ncbi:hypothetical protein OV450_3711 [Actinobacteria bacterium OV450]|nr:hypothetical protein OV450_3711 [Actinobacteria bacterium OV450]
MIVYPPDAEGERRVRVDGKFLGRATGPGDLFAFLRRAGLDPDDVHLDDQLLNEWRGGGSAVRTPDTDSSSPMRAATPVGMAARSHDGPSHG